MPNFFSISLLDIVKVDISLQDVVKSKEISRPDEATVTNNAENRSKAKDKIKKRKVFFCPPAS